MGVKRIEHEYECVSQSCDTQSFCVAVEATDKRRITPHSRGLRGGASRGLASFDAAAQDAMVRRHLRNHNNLIDLRFDSCRQYPCPSVVESLQPQAGSDVAHGEAGF